VWVSQRAPFPVTASGAAAEPAVRTSDVPAAAAKLHMGARLLLPLDFPCKLTVQLKTPRVSRMRLHRPHTA